MSSYKLASALSLSLLLAAPLAGQSLLSIASSVGDDSVTVTVFADGTARAALTEKGDDSGGGTGALGLRLALKGWALAANVAVASSVDTLRSGFGSSILYPGGGRSPAGLVEFYKDTLWGSPVGLHSYVSVSQAIWAADTLAMRVGVLGMGILASYSVGGAGGGESYGMRFEGGLSYRSIGGDVSSRGQLRMAMLGTRDTNYPGVELGVHITANHVTAGVQAYFLADAKDHKQVDGLTRFQMIFALRIEGAIVQKTLARTR